MLLDTVAKDMCKSVRLDQQTTYALSSFHTLTGSTISVTESLEVFAVTTASTLLLSYVLLPSEDWRLFVRRAKDSLCHSYILVTFLFVPLKHLSPKIIQHITNLFNAWPQHNHSRHLSKTTSLTLTSIFLQCIQNHQISPYQKLTLTQTLTPNRQMQPTTID